MYQVSKIGILCLISSFAYALPEDHHQKIHVIADIWNHNYKTGVTVYEGNVKVNQGTTHITADRLVTKTNSKHKISEAIAYGLKEKAHYWTLPKKGEQVMHANASVIKFYPLISNVTLHQNAVITQGENSFQGQLIHYNMQHQTITVPPSKDGRAVLVYNPDK